MTENYNEMNDFDLLFAYDIVLHDLREAYKRLSSIWEHTNIRVSMMAESTRTIRELDRRIKNKDFGNVDEVTMGTDIEHARTSYNQQRENAERELSEVGKLLERIKNLSGNRKEIEKIIGSKQVQIDRKKQSEIDKHVEEIDGWARRYGQKYTETVSSNAWGTSELKDPTS